MYYTNKSGQEVIVRSIHLDKDTYQSFQRKYRYLFNNFVRACLRRAVQDEHFFSDVLIYTRM